MVTQSSVAKLAMRRLCCAGIDTAAGVPTAAASTKTKREQAKGPLPQVPQQHAGNVTANARLML